LLCTREFEEKKRKEKKRKETQIPFHPKMKRITIVELG